MPRQVWLAPLLKPRVFALHRIAVSPRAYRAIKATLPADSIVYPPERNASGQLSALAD